MPPETTVFRIVQCDRVKGTLYGDFDALGHKESNEIVDLVREIIEGRPPEDYSPTTPLCTDPCPFYFRTRGKPKKLAVDQETFEEHGGKWTVINAEALLSDAAIEAMADLLLSIVEQDEQCGTERPDECD